MVAITRTVGFVPTEFMSYAGVAEGLADIFQALLDKTQGTSTGPVTQTGDQQSGGSGDGQSGDIIKQLIETVGDVLKTLITSVTQLLQTGIEALAPLLQQALQIAGPLLEAAGAAGLATAIAA
jgi:hypothetical protein